VVLGALRFADARIETDDKRPLFRKRVDVEQVVFVEPRVGAGVEAVDERLEVGINTAWAGDAR
jgi:hypothetical protein